ncbi:hypothetical protein P9209_18695 [Prescottella defluvii]|nr:hypothetical protein P9209_18695 [Prescottella defluvii]
MTTSWVAGTVRARALARRRIGAAAARALTTGDSAADAVQALSRTRTVTTFTRTTPSPPPSAASVRRCCGSCGSSRGGCRVTASTWSAC